MQKQQARGGFADRSTLGRRDAIRRSTKMRNRLGIDIEIDLPASSTEVEAIDQKLADYATDRLKHFAMIG
jgi:hypothetical protein